MKAANWEKFDGIIMAPGNPARMAALHREPAHDTPIVYVSTDAPRTGRIACVEVDAVISGGIAAELLARVVPSSASVAVFTGDLKIHDHADKLRGFAASTTPYMESPDWDEFPFNTIFSSSTPLRSPRRMSIVTPVDAIDETSTDNLHRFPRLRIFGYTSELLSARSRT